MKKIVLIAITAFGLEALVKKEIEELGYEIIKVADGRIDFEANINDIPRVNIWLRCAERILWRMGEFTALSFDELFNETKKIAWEKIIPEDGQIIVEGKAQKSVLGSYRACQAITKKAIIQKLKEKYDREWFAESGAEFKVQIAMLKNEALLTIDTSGLGLHKRGYRQQGGEAPLKETLAAALVKLSHWTKEMQLIDPMCGSGTILIEAAMSARNIAPGLERRFVAENWPGIGKEIWEKERELARKSIKKGIKLKIYGYDISSESIAISKKNAQQAQVLEDISFKKMDIKDLWIDTEFGMVISNFPYGKRMLDFKKINEIYISLHKTFKKKAGWGVYVLTADQIFPNYFKRAKPNKVRKLYNGKIKVDFYQYFASKKEK
jgi:putative N6-adenine-specific DNA methylase